MPNWAAGNIRVRGKRENIIRYIQENLIAIYELQDNKWEERPVHLSVDAGGYELVITRDEDTWRSVWFKNSKRMFIDFDDYSTKNSYTICGELSDDEKHTKEDQVLFLSGFKGAWGIDDECFRKAAVDYKVDIRIFVWERGMEWSSIATYYRDGHVEENSQTYSDWMWESALPDYGG